MFYVIIFALLFSLNFFTVVLTANMNYMPLTLSLIFALDSIIIIYNIREYIKKQHN